MKKQTAVDWLNSEFERMSNQIGVNLSWVIVDDLIKQAKEMEKNQIIQAVNEHDKKCVDDGNKIANFLKIGASGIFEYTGKEGENYYNQNFNNGQN